MNDKKCMALGRQYITACFGTKRQFKFFCEAIGHKIDDEWKSSHVISQKCKVKGCQKTIYVECYLCKEKIDKSMRYQALQKHLGSIHCLEVTKFLRTLDYAEDDENEPDLSHNVCPKEYTFVSEDIDDEYLSTLHSRKLLHPTPNDFVYDEKNMTYKMSITGVETLYGERMGEFKGIYKLLSMCDHGELLFKQCIVPVRGVTVIEDEFIVLFTKMPGSCRGHVLKNVKAAVCLSRALFRALSFLHKHDFVHNAIKPENLFFMEEVVAVR
jgi:serine/threonine protein kinase